MTEILLATLLALYRPPAAISHRIDTHREAIVSNATSSAERFEIPVGLLLSVGFLESHLGMDHNEPDWGAPSSRLHRDRAGNSDNAASALAWGFRACGTWYGAVSHFRSGLCRSPHLIGYSPETALHVAELIYTRSNVPLPEHWR